MTASPGALEQPGWIHRGLPRAVGVQPERLTERPRDLCQGRFWEAAVHRDQLVSEPPAPKVERGLAGASGWVVTGVGQSLASMVPSKMPGVVKGALRRTASGLDGLSSCVPPLLEQIPS